MRHMVPLGQWALDNVSRFTLPTATFSPKGRATLHFVLTVLFQGPCPVSLILWESSAAATGSDGHGGA